MDYVNLMCYDDRGEGDTDRENDRFPAILPCGACKRTADCRPYAGGRWGRRRLQRGQVHAVRLCGKLSVLEFPSVILSGGGAEVKGSVSPVPCCLSDGFRTDCHVPLAGSSQ